MNIDRKNRSLARIFKRQGLKLEVKYERYEPALELTPLCDALDLSRPANISPKNSEHVKLPRENATFFPPHPSVPSRPRRLHIHSHCARFS